VNETKLKLSRLAQKMTHIEDRVDHFTNEIREAFSKLSGKISERVLNDTKIESMMERHNHTVNAFEKKLMQMTRLVEESQNQLITTQTALEEARKEIARLKRL
jgi:chromosome segregation ATPase